tara:strand:- start:9 stop:338 length:330 start_codon:yes stop_codon:yes gene_type:complete
VSKKPKYKPKVAEPDAIKKVKRKKPTYESPTITLRKKVGLKETQEKDWEDVGLPTMKKDRRSIPYHINLVKGQNVKGGKGFKMKRKGVKSNTVKGVNVDMFKDKYKDKK